MEDTSKEAVSEQAPTSQEVSTGDTQNPIDPLTSCQAELADVKNRYLYLSAEFDNYKKRTAKEQTSWAEYAQDQSLLDLLTVVDDMERALHELEAQALPEEAVSHFKGFALIVKNFENLLKKYDVEEKPHAKVFDPEFFEAVMQQESPDHASGEIVTVLQKGYKRKDRVIRPAKVSVAQ